MATRLLLLACIVLGSALEASGQSREERLRRDRREQAETDREWRLKYEDDYKAFLTRTGQVYRRWTLAPTDLRKQYQADRRDRGLPALPYRIVHR